MAAAAKQLVRPAPGGGGIGGEGGGRGGECRQLFSHEATDEKGRLARRLAEKL